MTVTLQDVQKILGLKIRGRAVTGQCRSDGWRDRVEGFLGVELPEAGPRTRTSGVPISWLRQHFGHCPADANAQTVSRYCRAWILHLFGCVIFPDATGKMYYFISIVITAITIIDRIKTHTMANVQGTTRHGCTFLA